MTTEHDPVSGAEFPRERLHELIDEAGDARVRRERVQGWLIGIGLAILVLGLPSERLWGDMALVRMTSGSGETSAGILFPLAKLLSEVDGVSAEAACFLLAALAYGLLVPATLRLLRTIGFEHAVALPAAAAALTTPALLVGSSLPLDLAAGALGATWLLTSLFQPRERLSYGYQWRALLLFFVAFLLRPENALLLPAVAWAVTHQAGRARGPMAGVTLLLGASVALQILITGQAAAFWDTVLAGRAPAWGAAPSWLGYLTLGLGVSAFGVYMLLLDRRLPEETPAPAWMVPWCLVVLAPVVAGAPSAGPVGGFLVPAAAVGLADWLTRREREDTTRRAAMVLVALQLLLAAGLRIGWEVGDPDRGARATLREVLEPTDVVVTADPTRAYWCASRWGLDTRASLEGLEGGTGRVVLLDPPGDGAVLDEARTVHVLRDGALLAVPAGQPFRP